MVYSCLVSSVLGLVREMQRLSQLAQLLGIRRYAGFKYAADLALWVLAAPLAFYLRLEADLSEYYRAAQLYTLFGASIKAGFIYAFRVHRQSWHRVGVRDLQTLVQVVGLAVVTLLALGFLMTPFAPIPRSIPLLEGGAALIFLGGIRLLARLAHEWDVAHEAGVQARRVLVVGAGDAGAVMAREMFRHPEAGLRPAAFLDDEASKWGQSIMGLPVLGPIASLPLVVKRVGAEEVLIVMPDAPGEAVRRIVQLAGEAGVRYRIVPPIHEILSGRVSLRDIRDINLEDLLRRAPVRLDVDKIASYLKGQVVLVTGAGGSIGSEIVRQVARYQPRQIVLLGRGENSIHQIKHEMSRDHPRLDCPAVIADIQNRNKLAHVFSCFRPGIVFHAAAHKHVPLMEDNPDEAILNNVGGTLNLLEMALEYGVGRFVNLSTDKAVNPASIMGASKCLAEQLVMRTAERARAGQVFATVRFGNVLGSRGSVVPIFREQIRNGGPVTVTDPMMARYFMTIPEATQLVLEAGGWGENGAIYVLDMGQPVRIWDLAHDLIQLSGLRPGVDIDIAITGVRAGEKLTEELLAADEEPQDSGQEKILMARHNGNGRHPPGWFERRLNDLFAAAAARDERQIRLLLAELVPTYRASVEPQARLA